MAWAANASKQDHVRARAAGSRIGPTRRARVVFGKAVSPAECSAVMALSPLQGLRLLAPGTQGSRRGVTAGRPDAVIPRNPRPADIPKAGQWEGTPWRADSTWKAGEAPALGMYRCGRSRLSVLRDLRYDVLESAKPAADCQTDGGVMFRTLLPRVPKEKATFVAFSIPAYRRVSSVCRRRSRRHRRAGRGVWPH